MERDSMMQRMIEAAHLQQRIEDEAIRRAALGQHQREAAAIFQLLGIQHRPLPSPAVQPGNGKNNTTITAPTTPASTPVKKKRGRKKGGKNKKKTTDRLKPPPNYAPAKKQTMQDLLTATAIAKPLPPAIIPKVFLMDMGRKRKRHPAVDDQFEDAMEQRPFRVDNFNMDSRKKKKSRSNITANVLHTNDNYQRLEQQAEDRLRELARVTAERLKRQMYSVFEKVIVPATTADGGIFDDPEMSDESDNDFGTSTTIDPNVSAAVDANDHPRAISEPISIPSPTLANPHFAFPLSAVTPAFTDTLSRTYLQPTIDKDGQLDLKESYGAYLPPAAWEEVQQAPKMPHVPPDMKLEYPITKEDVKQYDIILGRGAFANFNPGNIWLRELVHIFKFAYFTADKQVKSSLAQSILNYIRFKGGHFLDKDTKKSPNYYEVGDAKGLLKVSQLMHKTQDVQSLSPSKAPPKQPQSQQEVILIDDSDEPPRPMQLAELLYGMQSEIAEKSSPQKRSKSQQKKMEHDQRHLKQSKQVAPVGLQNNDQNQRYKAHIPPQLWEEIRKAPVMPAVPPDAKRKNPIASIDVKGFDVLIDKKSEMAEKNAGNLQLQNWMRHVGVAYANVPEAVKTSMVKSILNYIRSKKGRFLEKIQFRWYEVGDERALASTLELFGENN